MRDMHVERAAVNTMIAVYIFKEILVVKVHFSKLNSFRLTGEQRNKPRLDLCGVRRQCPSARVYDLRL